MNILDTIEPKISSRAKEILEEFGKVESLSLSQLDFYQKVCDYEVLFVGLGLTIDKNTIDAAKKLKVIATATTGLDHIDVAYAKQKGIEILSLRGEDEFLNSITGTAELAFGLMLDVVRNVSVSFESVKNYQWDREKFCGHSVEGKILGIVGFGRLGKMMAKYGKAFGMKVIVCDPNKTKDESIKAGVKKVEFDELLCESDIISLHVHLSDETENMFTEKVFQKMKSSAYLINTSRGKIVNENDLLVALKNKTIAGYGADVLAGELNFSEIFENHPLVEYSKTHDNLIITPHIGGMTHESREATDIFMAEKLKKYLMGL